MVPVINQLVETATTEKNCFEHLPCILVLHHLLSLEDWNGLNPTQVHGINVYFCVRKTARRFNTYVGASRHHLQRIQTPD